VCGGQLLLFCSPRETRSVFSRGVVTVFLRNSYDLLTPNFAQSDDSRESTATLCSCSSTPYKAALPLNRGYALACRATVRTLATHNALATHSLYALARHSPASRRRVTHLRLVRNSTLCVISYQSASQAFWRSYGCSARNCSALKVSCCSKFEKSSSLLSGGLYGGGILCV
jgi:hypothetical protein